MSISNDLTPVVVDIAIPQGSDVYEYFQLFVDELQTIPFDLSDYTAESKVRKTYDSSTPILTLSTSNNKIKLGAKIENGIIVDDLLTNGGIALYYTSDDTSAIRFTGESLEAVRDIELTDSNGITKRVLQGVITISRESTR